MDVAIVLYAIGAFGLYAELRHKERPLLYIMIMMALWPIMVFLAACLDFYYDSDKE